jgi:hypothetical protein
MKALSSLRLAVTTHFFPGQSYAPPCVLKQRYLLLPHLLPFLPRTPSRAWLKLHCSPAPSILPMLPPVSSTLQHAHLRCLTPYATLSSRVIVAPTFSDDIQRESRQQSPLQGHTRAIWRTIKAMGGKRTCMLNQRLRCLSGVKTPRCAKGLWEAN